MENTKEWAPRLWQGCTLPAFLRLLWKNRFAVDPRFFYMPLVMTTVSAINSALALAMSVEPEGGSPTGLPTGPVIYQGPRLEL